MSERKHRTLATRNVLREGQIQLQRAARRRYPVTVGGFVWFIQFIIQAAALSVRVFFRRKIGERSFSPSLIFFSFFWVRCFLFNWKYTPPTALSESDVLLSYIYYYLNNIYSIFINSITFSFGEGSSFIYWYSFIVLLLGILHWLPVIKRQLSNENYFTFHRGESVFFGWLEGAEIEMGFDKKSVITNTFIRMVIDPLFIIILGFGVMFFLNETNFGLCIILSAIALFVEERGVYKEERNKVLDVLDGQYLGEQLEMSLNKYDQNEVQTDGIVSATGAVLATPDDAENMNIYIEANRGKNLNNSKAKLG